MLQFSKYLRKSISVWTAFVPFYSESVQQGRRERGAGGGKLLRALNLRGPPKKRDLRSLDFAQKCPQNAGNAISETLYSKIVGGMPQDPKNAVTRF